MGTPETADTERDVIVEHRADGSMAVTVIVPPSGHHAVFDCYFKGASVEPQDFRRPMVVLNARITPGPHSQARSRRWSERRKQ